MADTGFLGEMDVIEILRKKGHIIYIPLKDKGIDFVSCYQKKYYQIQVKTSKFQKKSYFWIDLHKNKMVYSKETVYVIVLFSPKKRTTFMGKKSNLLIIPSLDIKKWVKNKKIATKKGDSNILNVYIYPNLETKTLKYRGKGKELDVTKYWDNFEPFK